MDFITSVPPHTRLLLQHSSVPFPSQTSPYTPALGDTRSPTQQSQLSPNSGAPVPTREPVGQVDPLSPLALPLSLPAKAARDRSARSQAGRRDGNVRVGTPRFRDTAGTRGCRRAARGAGRGLPPRKENFCTPLLFRGPRRTRRTRARVSDLTDRTLKAQIPPPSGRSNEEEWNRPALSPVRRQSSPPARGSAPSSAARPGETEPTQTKGTAGPAPLPRPSAAAERARSSPPPHRRSRSGPRRSRPACLPPRPPMTKEGGYKSPLPARSPHGGCA